MPRSNSSSSRPAYSHSSSKSHVPARRVNPSPVHTHKVQQPGFLSNMWQGFGLGAGQSIAMNMFRSDPTVRHIDESTPSSTITQSTSELLYSKEYSQCLKDKYDDKETCKQYIQCLKDNNDDKTLCREYV